jgi:phosphatidylinositol alpha-1,6-mannosyltransferase
VTSLTGAVRETNVDALIVTPSFLPGHGGIETYLAGLCAELGSRVAVLAPETRGGEHLPRDLGFQTIGYPGSMVFPGTDELRAIRAAADLVGVDRILFGTPWPLILLGPRLARTGLRYGTVVHGAEMIAPSAVPVLRHRLIGAMLQADLLLPVSEYTEASLRRLFGGRNMPTTAILRARIDFARFAKAAGGIDARRRLGLIATDRIILTLGRLVRRKGVHRLIDAMPRINELLPDAVLVVVGTGPEERSLRKRATRSGAKIVFAGAVGDEEAAALYDAADVFALAVSDRWFGLEAEGLGVVLLEASASGTPCVTGVSGGTTEAVANGETGFVVDARDGSQLVDRIAALLANPALNAEMGRRAQEHVSSSFSNRELPGPLTQWLAGRYDSISTIEKGAEYANPSVGAKKQPRLKRRGPYPKRPREDRPQAKRY